MPSRLVLDSLEPRAEDTASTPSAERAATLIGEYRRLTTSEAVLSHLFLAATGTGVATHQTLASFRPGLRSPARVKAQRRILSRLA